MSDSIVPPLESGNEHSMLSSMEASLAESVCIVLARTTHPGNIGAVARAMKNMGLKHLKLVSPAMPESLDDVDEGVTVPHLLHESIRRASGAQDVLEAASVHETLEDALSDRQLVVGASARSRKMSWPLINPRECAALVLSQFNHDVVQENLPASSDAHSSHSLASMSYPKVALLFGNEASGLSNTELQRCHYHVNIPAVEQFASLNLAMAVQLICYELRMTMLESAQVKVGSSLDKTVNALSNGVSSSSLSLNHSDRAVFDDNQNESALATMKEVEGMLAHLEQTLVKIEFLDPDNPRQLMSKLRRLFQRAGLEKIEINILRGILKAMQKKIAG